MRSGGQDTILITRMSDEAAAAIDPAHPFTYYEMGRIGIVGSLPSRRQREGGGGHRRYQ